eukprot:353000-Chlamydomonas_euryale.AAC.24
MGRMACNCMCFVGTACLTRAHTWHATCDVCRAKCAAAQEFFLTRCFYQSVRLLHVALKQPICELWAGKL